MNAIKRRAKIPRHIAEADLQRRPLADQHIIVAGAQRRGGSQPDDFPQPPLDAVSFHRIADLLRHRKTDPDGSPILIGRLAGFVTPARLQNEGVDRGSRTRGGSPKVRPAFQPFHAFDFGLDDGSAPNQSRPAYAPSDYALSFLRPCARRALSTLRPPLVAMRARKP
jgi:hypothetical protein